MPRFLSALVLVVAAAFPLPAAAVIPRPAAPAPPPALEQITMSATRAFASANREPYMLRFRNDGSAEYDGTLKGRAGHYKATVSFADVRVAAEKEHACERPALELFREAILPPLPVMFARVSLYVSCADKDRVFSDSALSDSLLEIAAKLDWKYVGPPRHAPAIHFAQ